jgi:hypothetical protein
MDSNSDTSVVQPVASLYTDCTIPAPISNSSYLKTTMYYEYIYMYNSELDQFIQNSTTVVHIFMITDQFAQSYKETSKGEIVLKFQIRMK